VIDYEAGASPLGDVGSWVAAGYAGGTWAGNGVTSHVAAQNSGTLALGYAESSNVLGPAGGSFGGEGVDGSSVLVRLTISGDANLDGAVGFADLVRLAQNYNQPGRRWSEGDFNYDGNVGFADLVRLAQNYSSSLPAPVPAWGGEFAQDWALAVAAVPEPGGLGALGLTGAVLLRRRSKKSARP
jgi:hypothetical protein